MLLVQDGVVSVKRSLSQQLFLYNDVSRGYPGGVSRDRLYALSRNSTVITFDAEKGCEPFAGRNVRRRWP